MAITLTICEAANIAVNPVVPAVVILNPSIPSITATVTVGSTTTGAPGSNALVVNAGTPYAAILDFTIPRGNQGIQGIQGIQGQKGDTGDSGVVYATTPLSYNAGNKTISIDLSAYATQSFVTSQGYITISALSPYLTSATAASTYQTLAGMSSYLTTATAASTYYPLSGNPSGFLTSAPVTSVAGRTGDVTLAVADVSGAAPLASPTFTGTVTIPSGASIAGFATESWVTSQGYLTDAPSDSQTYGRNNGAWTVVSGGGGGATWGSITGSISAQTDLQTEFANYLPLIGGTLSGPVYSDSIFTTSYFSTYTTVAPGGLTAYDGTNTTIVQGTGVVFSDLTLQTTAAVTFTGGSITSSIYWNDGTVSTSMNDGNFLVQDSASSAYGVLYQNGMEVGDGTNTLKVHGTGITFADSTVQTTAAVAGIPDAPSDSQTYGRNNGAWTVVSGGGSFNGGAVANPITIAGTTIDSEMSSDYFGVELSSDHSQFAELTYGSLTISRTGVSTLVTPDGITFKDATSQTTAVNGSLYLLLSGGAMTGSLTLGGDLNADGYNLTNGNFSSPAGQVNCQNLTLTNGDGGSVTFSDGSIQTTASTGGSSGLDAFGAFYAGICATLYGMFQSWNYYNNPMQFILQNSGSGQPFSATSFALISYNIGITSDGVNFYPIDTYQSNGSKDRKSVV